MRAIGSVVRTSLTDLLARLRRADQTVAMRDEEALATPSLCDSASLRENLAAVTRTEDAKRNAHPQRGEERQRMGASPKGTALNAAESSPTVWAWCSRFPALPASGSEATRPSPAPSSRSSPPPRSPTWRSTRSPSSRGGDGDAPSGDDEGDDDAPSPSPYACWWRCWSRCCSTHWRSRGLPRDHGRSRDRWN